MLDICVAFQSRNKQNMFKEEVRNMEKEQSLKTITEPAKKIKIFREADVIVVGGGPGGIGAAISASRAGADTVLIERYGHLGGMATGGLVNIIPNLGLPGVDQ
jgi:ribulose 1,5-bisphosphate synthetase/thiazole synthase